MSEVPDHITARRAQVRRRRRRRRRQAGAGMVGAVIAVVAAVVLLTAGGGRAHSPADHRGGPPAAVGALAVGRVRQPGARARRALERLISLGLPVYCGGHRGRELAFTFDDGPGVYTHLALRKLAAAHEHATFFLVGRSIEAWPGYLRREARLGALGDHTFTHADLVAMPPRQAYDEIVKTQRLIERDSSVPVALFRPPYGAHDRAVDEIVRRLGMLDVLWSVDSGDSLGANWQQIIRNVEHGMRPGAIIELHENRGQTIRALTTLLPMLARRHLRSVSVPALLTSDPPAPAQLRRGEAGCGQPTRIPGRGSE